MRITHGTLSIRNATPEDAPRLCRWWNDGTVMAHAGFPLGLQTSTEAVRQDLSTDSEDTGRRLIIEADHRPIGEMSYRNKGGDVAEIGIKICDAGMQERGHGTLCLRMLITALFADGYAQIILDTNADNVRAQHVYEKLGFEKLRVNHHAWTDQLGRPQSSVDYALRRADFVPLAGCSVRSD